MNKKIYITESQLQNILNEELSIAKETVELSKTIINSIFAHIEHNEREFTIDAPYNTKINVIIYSFESNKELSKWLDVNGNSKLFNGFSFKDNTFYIRGIEINGDIDCSIIENNVYHEVEHFIQSLKKGKPLTGKKYNIISKYMNSDDIVVSFVCTLLYFTTKFELDAYINGFYSDLKKMDLGRMTLSDILEQTECGILLKKFITWKDNLDKWTKTLTINAGRIKLYNLGVVKYTNLEDLKNFLIKRLNKSQTYLLKRVGKVYALSKKEYDSSINESTYYNEDMFLYGHDGIHKRVKMNDAKSISNLKQFLITNEQEDIHNRITIQGVNQ